MGPRAGSCASAAPAILDQTINEDSSGAAGVAAGAARPGNMDTTSIPAAARTQRKRKGPASSAHVHVTSEPEPDAEPVASQPAAASPREDPSVAAVKRSKRLLRRTKTLRKKTNPVPGALRWRRRLDQGREGRGPTHPGCRRGGLRGHELPRTLPSNHQPHLVTLTGAFVERLEYSLCSRENIGRIPSRCH